jgi:hypothetical protein
VAGDISRRKKVKEKRPSPFLFPQTLPTGKQALTVGPCKSQLNQNSDASTEKFIIFFVNAI